MIEIRITGESFSQVKEEVLNFFSKREEAYQEPTTQKTFDPKSAETQRGFVADRMHKHTEEKVAKLEEEKKEERKATAKKKKTRAKKKAQETETETKSEVKALTPNKEAVHEALQEVASSLNLNAARDILLEFGCERVSDLKEAQYIDFIEACEAAVK